MSRMRTVRRATIAAAAPCGTTGLTNPMAIAQAGDGSIYVTHFGGDSIVRVLSQHG
jgi:hypothetical protein